MWTFTPWRLPSLMIQGTLTSLCFLFFVYLILVSANSASLYIWERFCPYICCPSKCKCEWCHHQREREVKRLCLAVVEKKVVHNLELWEHELFCQCPGFRMVSCGRDNIRLWRVRNGTLRSCPVNLGEYHSLDFTDVAFGEGNSSNQHLDDRTLWVSKQVTETI